MGVSENNNESHIDTEKKTLDVFSKIGVPTQSQDIDIAHRVGKYQHEKPRQIIVRLSNMKAKINVLKNRYKLKGQGVIVVEDLTTQNTRLFTDIRRLSFVTQAWTKDGTVFAKGTEGHVVRVDHNYEVDKLKGLLTRQAKSRATYNVQSKSHHESTSPPRLTKVNYNRRAPLVSAERPAPHDKPRSGPRSDRATEVVVMTITANTVEKTAAEVHHPAPALTATTADTADTVETTAEVHHPAPAHWDCGLIASTPRRDVTSKESAT
ncbi:hypothetical protein ElyMa_001193700 [Elysia marginata]|uniref:Uncharacterized protein n=1 Tax=Elysia marginata TaxID=1093978 RepID=A0AAV4I415_9GAST|nr:hypothetical protein ElyMa_001193700 [Elysia marginata]